MWNGDRFCGGASAAGGEFSKKRVISYWMCYTSVMFGDTVGQSRHLLLFSCDLWLRAKDLDTPENFDNEIQTVKRDAANARDHRTLQAVTERFLALTGKLAVEDWKQYESICTAADVKELAEKNRLRRRLARPSCRAGSRHF